MRIPKREGEKAQYRIRMLQLSEVLTLFLVCCTKTFITHSRAITNS